MRALSQPPALHQPQPDPGVHQHSHTCQPLPVMQIQIQIQIQYRYHASTNTNTMVTGGLPQDNLLLSATICHILMPTSQKCLPAYYTPHLHLASSIKHTSSTAYFTPHQHSSSFNSTIHLQKSITAHIQKYIF